MVLGAVFTMGVIVVLVGLFGSRFGVTGDRRGLMAILGGAISLASVMMKNFSEFAANRNLSACRDEMQSLQAQLGAVRQDREALDPDLTASSEPFAVRLQQSQETLDQLLELKPLGDQQQAFQQRVQSLQQQQLLHQQQLQQAEQQWREALQSFHLPEMMTPEQFAQLSQTNSPLDQLRIRLLALRQEVGRQQTEWESFQQQVQQLCDQAELIPEQEQPEHQVEELARDLKTARQSQKQRDTLFRQWRQLGREQDQVAKAAQRLRESRARLLQKYEISDSRELAATLAQRARR